MSKVYVYGMYLDMHEGIHVIKTDLLVLLLWQVSLSN